MMITIEFLMGKKNPQNIITTTATVTTSSNESKLLKSSSTTENSNKLTNFLVNFFQLLLLLSMCSGQISLVVCVCVCSKPMVNWLIEFFFVLSVFLYFRFDNLFVRKLTLCFCFSHHYYWFFSINALWFMFNGTNFSIFFSIPESNKWKTKQTKKKS